MTSLHCLTILNSHRPNAFRPKGTVYLLPTAAGLFRPLDTAFPAMAKILAESGYITHVLEFPGQRGRRGEYSVAASCDSLTDFISEQATAGDLPVVLFGICTGAVAALWAAHQLRHKIASVFCWELSAGYSYTTKAYESLAERFGLEIDWDRALEPVQPRDLLGKVRQPVCLAMSERSKCTTENEQRALSCSALTATQMAIPRTSHVPGIPKGSEVVIAQALAHWCETTIQGRCDEQALSIFN